jgi:hypothetical protein
MANFRFILTVGPLWSLDMKFVAENYLDLKQQLSATDVPVKDRGKGRKKVQTETWICKRFIFTLCDLQYIYYPMKVEFKDRPDLRLYMSNDSFGIEITEIVPESYAQADAIRNKYYPGATVDRSIFTWGAEYTSKQIHDHLSTVGKKTTGPGWTGDAVEKEWATAVNNSIKEKQEKLNKEGYDLFSKNCLTAYTSTPGPMLNINKACSLITPPKPEKDLQIFDEIFVLTDNFMAILNNAGHEIYALVK